MNDIADKTRTRDAIADATASASSQVDDDLPAPHRKWLEQMSALTPETAAVLKPCIGAAAALARLDAVAARSPLVTELAEAGQRLDVAAALLLQGESVSVEDVLSHSVGGPGATVQRSLDMRQRAVQQAEQDGVDASMVQGLADCCVGRSNAIRSRALGARERRGLVEGQRLVNDVASLAAGLQAWTAFVERGSDADSLLHVGSIHRRWMNMRPFTAGNVSVGFALTQALLQAESGLAAAGPPVAWRMARSGSAYRHALVEDEASWLIWWCAALQSSATHWLDTLTRWESLYREVLQCQLDAGPDVTPVEARVLCRAGFSLTDLTGQAEVSRERARHLVDTFLSRGWLVSCGSERGQGFRHTRVLRLLCSPSLTTQHCNPDINTQSAVQIAG